MSALKWPSPEELARQFHGTYEAIAPDFGYETRRDSAVAWEAMPGNNKALMIEVSRRILEWLLAESASSSYTKGDGG